MSNSNQKSRISEFAELFEKTGMQGYDKGPVLDVKEARKKAPNRHQACDDKIDFHGKTVREVTTSLPEFIKLSRRRKFHKVLIICGKGIHSEGGISRLRPEIINILIQLKANHLLKDFETAQPKDGGYGALYVYL